MENIRPLSSPQQRMLQYILARHVIADHDLQYQWEQQREVAQQMQEALGRDLKETLCLINRSLIPAFGIEIRSMTMPTLVPDEDQPDDEGEMRDVLFHTIINTKADHVSTLFANTTLSKNPHEFALFRLIIERIVEKNAEMINEEEEQESNDDGDENNNDGSRKRRRKNRRFGCQSFLSRIEMINLRTELTGVHAGKLVDITQVENLIHMLEAQGWLVPAAHAGGGSSSGRRKGRGKHSGATHLQLGARSYMEFPHFLTNAGLEKELLPQFIIHH